MYNEEKQMNKALLKRLRIIKGLHTNQVAEALGMPVSTYASLEDKNPQRPVPSRYMIPICELYGITPNQYFGYEKIVIEIENENVALKVDKKTEQRLIHEEVER